MDPKPNPSDQDIIDEACLAYEEAVAEGKTVNLEDLLPPGRQDLLPRLQKEIQILEQMKPLGQITSPFQPATPQQKDFGPRYGTGRLHAQGGLGQVFVARDAEIQREVAVKCLKEGMAKPVHLEQFLREADKDLPPQCHGSEETTASLGRACHPLSMAAPRRSR